MRPSHWIAAAIAAIAMPALAQHRVDFITPRVSTNNALPHISAVVVHPLDGNRLLAGFSQDRWDGPGTLRASNDGGKTWDAPVGVPAGLNSVERMHAHRGLPGVVFLEEGSGAITGPGIIPGTHSTRIWVGRTWRSDDFGLTWSVVNAPAKGELNSNVAPFGSDPRDVNRILATRRSGFDCGLNCFGSHLGGDLRVVDSLDGGHGWNDLPGVNSPSSTSRALNWAFDAPAPYISRMFFSNGETVFVSRDFGRTWSVSDVRPVGRVVWMHQDPRVAARIYAFAELPGSPVGGYARFYRSDDDGATWNALGDYAKSITSTSQAVAPTLTIDPSDSRILWLTGLDSGVSVSADEGLTWTAFGFPASASFLGGSWVNPLESALVNGIVLSPSQPGVGYIIWRDELVRLDLALARDPVIVEYEYEGARYWLTSLRAEALSQDYRQQPGDVQRTGARWGAWRADDAPAGAVGSCRFWPKPTTGLRTRVMLLKDGDCQFLKASPDWILEAEDEFFAVPSADHATCPAGLVAVRRFHNLKADLNHRWVADAQIAAQMRSRGWFDEGVRFCARPLGSNE